MARRHRAAAGQVLYPDKPNESDLSYALRNLMQDRLGLEGRGQVQAYVIFCGKLRRCMFDLAVFDDLHQCIAIIEVKARTNRPMKKLRKTAQVSKYSSFGIPVLSCRGPHDFEYVLSDLQALKNQDSETGTEREVGE